MTGQSCQEFVSSRQGNEYIITDHDGTLAVQGAEDCPAAYCNEGFEDWNAALWFDRHDPSFFLCLRGVPLEEVVYEISTNYGAKGEPSDFWTAERRKTLAPDIQIRCDNYYPLGPVQGPALAGVTLRPAAASGTTQELESPEDKEEEEVPLPPPTCTV